MKTFNTVICTLNSQYIHSSLAPWCLLSGVRAYCGDGIDAFVEEGTVNESLDGIAGRITAHEPSAVGFCCYIWNITATYKLINIIKSSLPHVTVVLGGPEVGYRAESVLNENSDVDFVLSGEGERPFALLLNALHAGACIKDLPGLCYREKGGVVTAQPYISEEDPPSPYTQEYFDALRGRIAYLETSRGCPYTCAFCLSGRCGGIRFFDTDRAKRELLALANSGAKTVKLVDRTFNANRKRATQLFGFIIEKYGSEIPVGVCFHFEIAGDILDDRTINLLASAPAGAIQLEIGLQSFNPTTLESIKRVTDIDRLIENISRIVDIGNIHVHIDLIAGLPYEDKNSFIKGFNTAYTLKPHMLQLGFLKLLYGSAIRENPSDFPCEYSDLPPYEVTRTPWITSAELDEIRCAESALNRLYNSGRFRRTLDYLVARLSQYGCTPYDLFYGFGIYSNERGANNMPLDEYTALVLDYFGKQPNICCTTLRDHMVCDRLAVNSSGVLPDALRIEDAALRRIKHEIDRKDPRKAGVRRSIAMLYNERCAVYADYQDKNPVTGEYRLKKYF